jgi:cob(I)alamin adenosyltransferase
VPPSRDVERTQSASVIPEPPPLPRRPDEPVRLTRIYTRTGDTGETHLGDLSRASKTDPLVEAYGAVDELNSLLGWAAVDAGDSRLARIQNELFDLGADLSVPFAADDGKLRIDQAAIDRLEAECDAANEELPPLKSFILPGGSERAARLHVARAVCRRAERVVIAARAERPVNPLASVYLNRLSDLLFILARAANAAGDEPLWRPGGDR